MIPEICKNFIYEHTPSKQYIKACKLLTKLKMLITKRYIDKFHKDIFTFK